RHGARLAVAEVEDLGQAHGWRALEPACFLPPPTLEREADRRTAVDAVDLHVGLDAGVVAALLAEERPLRRVIESLTALLLRARDEGERSETHEPTPYLVAL